jgi:hypothetical protein
MAGWVRGRWKSLNEAVGAASNAEKVRAFLALTLVGVLIVLQFVHSDRDDLTTATETLAITVVAFYFGLHGGGGGTGAGRRGGGHSPH